MAAAAAAEAEGVVVGVVASVLMVWVAGAICSWKAARTLSASAASSRTQSRHWAASTQPPGATSPTQPLGATISG